MKKFKTARGRGVLAVLFVLTLIVALIPTLTLAADPDFKGNSAFLAKWQRTDKPVADGRVSRSWLWGPEVARASNEPYAEAPGGSRSVVYLDKARMEINDPSKGTVTNGLLVKELISGQLALGDAKTQTRQPGDISVAGDPGNPGPTYASFRKVSTLNNTDNNAASKIGQAVEDTLSRDGTTGKNAALGLKAKVAYYDNNLKHNIADVFWAFMNQRGVIWDGSKFVDNQPVFDWLDAMGLPISEGYWSQVVVGGQPKDVLIQAFERRVLTYTPSNSAAFQVEMGNVGQHYLSWRNDARYDGTAPVSSPTPVGSTPTPGGGTPPPTGSTPPPPPSQVPTDGGSYTCVTSDIPKDNNANVFIPCGPAGFQQIMFGIFMTPGESVDVFMVSALGQTLNPVSAQADEGGVLSIRYDVPTTAPAGLSNLNYRGTQSGKTGRAYFKVTAPFSSPSIAMLRRDDGIFAALIVAFTPGEKIIISYTSPSGTVSYPAIRERTTSTTGSFTNLISPKLDLPGGEKGAWVVTARSVSDPGKSASAVITLT